MKVPTRIAGWLIGVLICLVSSRAHAWLETRLVSDLVHLEVDRAGSLLVEHRVTVRIAGGPLKSYDLASSDRDIVPMESTVSPATSDGAPAPTLPLELQVRPDGGLRLQIVSPRGISRGTFLFLVRYRRALVAGDDIRRDGAMLRVRWTAPRWTEGRDNVRCTFVLPAAPTPPRPPTPTARTGDNPSNDEDPDPGAFLSEVKRGPETDEVTLIRPHVARSEAVTWAVLLDPRAMGESADARLRPPPREPPRPQAKPEERASHLAATGLLLFGFSLLVAAKSQQVARLYYPRARPRPLLPIPTAVRVLLAGPLLAGGIALQLELADPMPGTLTVLLAMCLTWYRAPICERAPRGPGKWLPLSDEEAFAKPHHQPRAWLDASTRFGQLVFLAALVAIAAAVHFVAKTSMYDAYLLAFDAAALFPLFGTGKLSELPPLPFSGRAARLQLLARELRKRTTGRTIAWARLPEGRDEFDELRLLCSPRLPLRGFIGIEVGLVPVAGAGGFLQLPEVLVRAVDASPCQEAFSKLVPGSRWVRGRRADERVLTIAPRLPTLAMTAALTVRLLDHARDTAPPRVAPKAPAVEKAQRARQRSGGAPAANAAKAENAATRSAGSPECASSAGTTASPLQPT